jgi:hypothetical protein
MAVQRWGSQTIVNTKTAGNQFVPTVEALADGGYVIAWQDGDGVGDTSIRAQRFDATGRKVGGEFLVNTPGDLGHNGAPSVVGLTNGGFLIGWSNQFSSTNVDITVSAYNSAGVKTSERLPVSSNADEQAGDLTTNGAGAAIAYANTRASTAEISFCSVSTLPEVQSAEQLPSTPI